MNKQLFIKPACFLLGLFIFASSCKKAGNDAPKPINGDNNHPLITRYEYAPNLYTLFSYNNAGQITGITDINDIARSGYTVTYKTDGKVDRITNGNGFWKYTYNSDNLLAQADAYTTGNPVPQAYYRFIFDGQKVTQVL